MFFFHGENDEIVPRLSPTRMVAKLADAGVPAELYVIPQCGHIMACMNWAAIERSADFLDKHLKPQAGP
jgi:dipeptidyl aminopeptidase/acylaminoacyl peptidase